MEMVSDVANHSQQIRAATLHRCIHICRRVVPTGLFFWRLASSTTYHTYIWARRLRRSGCRERSPVTHSLTAIRLTRRWRVSDRSPPLRASIPRAKRCPVSRIINKRHRADVTRRISLDCLLRGAAPRAGKASKHGTPHPPVSLSLTRLNGFKTHANSG
jgi:hypothetical protein